jgi:hypothetical protein
MSRDCGKFSGLAIKAQNFIIYDLIIEIRNNNNNSFMVGLSH